MKFKKILSFMTLACLLTVGFTGCGKSEPDGSNADSNGVSNNETITIRLADMPIWTDATFSYAQETGILDQYFADYNVKFEISVFESGPAINETFASDGMDFAMMGNMPAVIGVTNDYGTKIIGIDRTSEYVGSVVVPVDSDITSLEELKGKTIGTIIGGGIHYYTGVYLESVGLTLNDVNLINTGSESATSIRNGEIDAVVMDPVVAQQLITEGSGKIIVDKYQEEPESLIVGSEKFIEKYPELTEVMLKAIQATNEKIDSDRDAFFDFLGELTGSDITSIKEAWDQRKWQVKNFSDSELASMSSLLEWMKENEMVSNTDFKADDLYDLTYIENAGLK